MHGSQSNQLINARLCYLDEKRRTRVEMHL